MNPFVYYTPTKVVFESNAESLAGEMLKELGYKKILIHYGKSSVNRSGLLDRVKDSIPKAGLSFAELGGVVPNPLLSKVYEGIKLAKKENVDAIIAVGGGSVIDSAKAIGMGLCYDGDVWDFFEGKATPSGCIPITTVLTLAAAGSEMSDSCVVTKDDGMLKRYCGHPDSACKFALMNPELMLTLPDYQTACGCVDIIMHTMERYFNNTTILDVTDYMSEAVMQAAIKHARILKENPQNIESRWNIMWVGSLAHNGLTGCGTNGGDWSTHDIEHELGGMYDVAHGAGLAAVWGSWARYVVDVIPQRFEKFAINVLGLKPLATQKETALAGIKAVEEFFSYINMPISLTELEVSATESEIEDMATKATHFGKKLVGSVKPLDKQDIINILTAAK